MVSSPDLALWMLTTLVEAFVVCLFLARGLFRKFLFFNLYLTLCVVLSLGRYLILLRFGLRSSEYSHFYFYTDAVLTLALFLGICELGVRLVGTEMRWRFALLSAGALVAAAWVSYSVVSLSPARMGMHFLFELSENIFWVCTLAIVLLWTWKLRNNPEDRTAARLINVLSVYFLLVLLAYGARQLAPHTDGLRNLLPMSGAWLSLGCGFALVSREDSRGM
jgi:hypothetical protein